MAHLNHRTARRMGTGSQEWDLTMVVTCMFTYSADFVFFLVLLALFPLTNHGDTCCYFRLVIIAIFCTAKRIATAHSHKFYTFRIFAFTAQLIS